MKLSTAIFSAIGLLGGAAIATMSPANLQDTSNALARQAFDVKDLVVTISATQSAALMKDVFDEMDDLYETVLANIQLVIGSAALTEESQDVQLVYEAYSYLVQGMFELMDTLGSSATNFIAADEQNEFRVPASIREVGGVIDAWMFNMIGLFPSNTSYADEAANQKNQVDSHFRHSIAAYHLATAKTSNPYGNITNIVSLDGLTTNNSTEPGFLTTESSNDDGTSGNAGSSDTDGNTNNVGNANDGNSNGDGKSNNAGKSSNTDSPNNAGTSNEDGNSYNGRTSESDGTANDDETSQNVGTSKDSTISSSDDTRSQSIGTSSNTGTGNNPEECTQVEKKIITRTRK
ncbi:uncharacterized protein LTHEOB_114 [Neofusicoccum parvum]|nr:uncharacterized protein LTHEOB_114 [Neofusicoccum parvum]